MVIFSKTSKVQEVAVLTASKLKQQSFDALDTFQKVLQELKSINDASSKRQEELDSEATRIALEIKELETINTSNDRVIRNIEKIIS